MKHTQVSFIDNPHFIPDEVAKKKNKEANGFPNVSSINGSEAEKEKIKVKGQIKLTSLPVLHEL